MHNHQYIPVVDKGIIIQWEILAIHHRCHRILLAICGRELLKNRSDIT